MVRGNTSQECLTEYFKLINYTSNKSLIKKEFNSIELLKKETHWVEDSHKKIYTALKDNASIFIIYDHGVHEMLVFTVGSKFEIDESGNYVFFNQSQVTSHNI